MSEVTHSEVPDPTPSPLPRFPCESLDDPPHPHTLSSGSPPTSSRYGSSTRVQYLRLTIERVVAVGSHVTNGVKGEDIPLLGMGMGTKTFPVGLLIGDTLETSNTDTVLPMYFLTSDLRWISAYPPLSHPCR